MKAFANNQLVLPEQLEANKDHTTLVSLTIENQKNGCKGNIFPIMHSEKGIYHATQSRQ